eukprot:6113814-Lingulodinium_polyedra.AAC.1
MIWAVAENHGSPPGSGEMFSIPGRVLSHALGYGSQACLSQHAGVCRIGRRPRRGVKGGPAR